MFRLPTSGLISLYTSTAISRLCAAGSSLTCSIACKKRTVGALIKNAHLDILLDHQLNHARESFRPERPICYEIFLLSTCATAFLDLLLLSQHTLSRHRKTEQPSPAMRGFKRGHQWLLCHLGRRSVRIPGNSTLDRQSQRRERHPRGRSGKHRDRQHNGDGERRRRHGGTIGCFLKLMTMKRWQSRIIHTSSARSPPTIRPAASDENLCSIQPDE